MMKAAWYERNGNARDVLHVGEVEPPSPQPGEVRVRVSVSGVNPSDVKSRRGRPLVGQRVIPHSDGAGVIEAVGANVPHGRIGERVWIWNGQWKRSSGTAAELICVPSEQAVHLPDRIDFAAGACLGIPALTAVHAVRTLGQIGGKTLLVTGAGSSVGYYVTQIAKLAGARVIGTASAAKADHARQAGADFVIDYTSKDVTKVVKDLTRGKGVDAIADIDLGSTSKLINEGIAAAHSNITVYGSNVPGDISLSWQALLWNSYTLRFFVIYEILPDERRAALDALGRLLETNALKHSVGARFLLRDIAASHETVEAGKTIGNVVLDIA